MHLPAFIVIVFCAVKSSSSSSGSTEHGSVPVNRQSRGLSPSNSGAIRNWAVLRSAVTAVTQTKPVSPLITYVEKRRLYNKSRCVWPFTDVGCPDGYVCSLAYSCVPKTGQGKPCLQSDQCQSGSCHRYRCVEDQCLPGGDGGRACPRGEQCISSEGDYKCRPRDDTCPSALTLTGCPTGQYCGRDRHCAPRRGVGAECDLSVQCLGGACRDGRCKLDRCPDPGSTQDCDPGQFCASGSTGNACRPQLRDGHECDSDVNCLSHLCERGRCVRHECRKPFGAGQCLHHQFCEPTLRGNVCSERLARGARCDSDQACQSGACRSGLCFSDQCPQPMTELGCGPLEYCSRDLYGNSCLRRRPNNVRCSDDVQCLSNLCDIVCRPQPTPTEPPTCPPVQCPTVPPPVPCPTVPPPVPCPTPPPPVPCPTPPPPVPCPSVPPPVPCPTAPPLVSPTPLPDGMGCDVDEGCLSGRCFRGMCSPRLKENGEECGPPSQSPILANTQCRSWRCLNGEGVLRCEPGAVPSNFVCTDDLQCASQQCDDGLCT